MMIRAPGLPGPTLNGSWGMTTSWTIDTPLCDDIPMTSELAAVVVSHGVVHEVVDTFTKHTVPNGRYWSLAAAEARAQGINDAHPVEVTTHLINRRFRRGRYHQWAYDSTFCGDYSLDPRLTQHLS